MSRKPVFEKIAKVQRYFVPLRGRTTFVLLTPTHTMTIIDKINDVNKTLSAVKLLAINILCYFVIKEVNDGLGIKSSARLKTFV